MDVSGSTVLVTGGAGFIGSHVVDLLLDRGCKVKILDNLDANIHRLGAPDWIPGEAEFIPGSVQNPADVARTLTGVDFVFHQVGLTSFVPEAAPYMEVNATGTATVYEVIAKQGFPVKKIVAASSQAIYGEGKSWCQADGVQYPDIRPLQQLRKHQWNPRCPRCDQPLEPLLTDEDAAKNGSTPYAIGKLAGERLALTLGRKFEIPTTALRYGVTYGPRQSVFNPYGGVVPTFAARLINNRPPVIYEDGHQLRDWIYVGDVARANLFVMEDERADFESYNVGTGVATTVRGIAAPVASHLGKQIEPLINGEFRPGDVRHLIHDTSKLQSLGFKVETPLEEGIGRFLEWFMGLKEVEDSYTALEGQLKSAGSLLS